MPQVNTRQVFRAWNEGRSSGMRGGSIWTDGTSIFSYDVCILAQITGGVVLNMRRYSLTTTRQQRGIHAFLCASPVGSLIIANDLHVSDYRYLTADTLQDIGNDIRAGASWAAIDASVGVPSVPVTPTPRASVRASAPVFQDTVKEEKSMFARLRSAMPIGGR